MEKLSETRSSKLAVWNYMEIFGWILYSLSAVTFIFIHLNIVDGKTLVGVPLNGKSVTFGIPTLIFLLGSFIHIWSIYLERYVKDNSGLNIFLRSFGFAISTTIAAFLLVVVFSYFE